MTTSRKIILLIRFLLPLALLFFGSFSFVSVAENKVESIEMTIGPGETVRLPETFVRTDVVFKASLKFKKFEKITIGLGEGRYTGGALEITPESYLFYDCCRYRPDTSSGVKRYVLDSVTVSRTKWNDGPLGRSMSITIASHKDGADLTIKTGSRTYTGYVDRWWEGGAPYLTNQGSTPMSVKLSFERLKAEEPVWFLADSYFSTRNKYRWPFYMYKEGYDHWMADHIPGGGSPELLQSFIHDLEFGTPKIAVWMLGMNDGSDKDGKPCERWLVNVEKFIAICREKGIEPVLVTVPTVPERFHDCKTEWVRSSGCRYIDWYKACGTDSKGQWTEGYLYEDKVHPSQSGAEALWKAVKEALPELSTGTPIYHKGWTDFNKNGVKDVYEDPKASIDARVEDLLSQMTLEEKTCQMVTLYGYRRVLKDQLPTEEWKSKLWKDGLGALDEHLNSFVGWSNGPTTESPWIWPASKHAEAMNIIQRWFIENTRLGVPVDFTDEGIRGVEAYKSTNFPTQLATGCTWDRDLVRQMGYITGREARLLGFTNVYAPILDVGRDPRWGRYEEIYGEDPYLVAQLGIQMVRGMQTDSQIAATAKHFAIYSAGKAAREGMARCDPHEAPHEVENIHIYPWRQVIRHAGLMGCMSSYNDYDGEPIQGSRYWLTERLRDDLGFRGYVVSDSDAVEYLYTKHHVASTMKESVRQSVEAGLNVRCTFLSPDSYVLPLRELVREGSLSEKTVDDRVRDILRVKFTTGLFDHPYVTDAQKKEADVVINGKKNNEMALRASLESLVLLKNNGLLPVDASKLKRVAVIGPNADEDGYAHIHYGPQATESVTVLSGFKTALKGKAEVVYAKGCKVVDSKWPESEILGYEPTKDELDSIAAAVTLAKESDLAVVVLGGDARTCGENRSRSSLDLPGCQDLLLKEIYRTGTPVVLVLISGRPLSINWADRYVPSIIQAFYPGAHGGTAVAQAILGQYNPGGKLTVTFPKTVGQIPYNFPYKPNSQIDGYTGLGPKGGQTRINGALYEFGHGLSYTTFEYSDIKLSSTRIMPSDSIVVSFSIKNTGAMAGDEVAQLYLHDVESSITVYEKMLRGFERIHLEPGETKTVTMTLSSEDLTMLDRNMKPVVEPGVFEIYIGSSSRDIRLSAPFTVIDPADPDKVFTLDSGTGLNGSPVKLKQGEEVTFPLKQDVPFSELSIRWGKGTDCRYEIQLNRGGGQFNTVASGSALEGLAGSQLPGKMAGSDVRIVVTEGRGTIVSVYCDAIK